jgi:hypothetical protein
VWSYTGGLVADVATLSWQDPRNALTFVAAGAEGFQHGQAIVANTFTFGQITPLNNYVEQIVAENGGLYGASQGFATLGREALITAATLGVGQVLRGGAAVYSARTLLAAKAAQPVLFAREAYQTSPRRISRLRSPRAKAATIFSRSA